MIWLLDTNVISELKKPRPRTEVLNWIEQNKSEEIWTSRVCLAEIMSGITRRQGDIDRAALQNWYQLVVLPMFDGKTFDVTGEVLLDWLDLQRDLQAKRGPTPPVDLLVASTCRVYSCAVATRDVVPFVAAGVATINPFTGERFNGA
jgi:toxin FitB